jgi:hypothetical protein
MRGESICNSGSDTLYKTILKHVLLNRNGMKLGMGFLVRNAKDGTGDKKIARHPYKLGIGPSQVTLLLVKIPNKYHWK